LVFDEIQLLALVSASLSATKWGRGPGEVVLRVQGAKPSDFFPETIFGNDFDLDFVQTKFTKKNKRSAANSGAFVVLRQNYFAP